MRKSMSKSTIDMIKQIRKFTDLPLMAGFGVCNKDQTELIVSKGAKGVNNRQCSCRDYMKKICFTRKRP